MRTRTWAIFLGIAMALAAAGCQKPVFFPAEPTGPIGGPGGPVAYDTDGNGVADYFLLPDAAGRAARIGYDRTGDGAPDEIVDLDAITFADCRHLVIILDGVGYDLAKDFHDAGHLRLFHPPSRVVAPYPTLTDLCFEDFFGHVPCKGFEAEYYDHKAGKIAGGSCAYLRGDNAPYNDLLHYRADLIMDAIGYLYPWEVYGKEVNDAKRLFDRNETKEVRAYLVSSAGVGTSMGAEGHRRCLLKAEQLANQVVWETGGKTKVTLLADHGHTYTPAKRVGLEDHLTGRGWRLTDRLRAEKDAAYIRFGLETYASFATRSPAALARDAVDCEGVELASYAEKDAVVVLAPGGARAAITQQGGRFGYAAQSGDPLGLQPILAKLMDNAAGLYDADELLKATTLHVWPAPLQRLWRAHFGLVADPADVIVSLADDYYSGSRGFAAFAKVASTHGGLNYRNSTTFIMSTAGPLPAVMRSGDVPAHMKALTGAAWPAKK